MAPRRRSPLLNADKQREICAILTVGGSRRTAAKYVGCSHDTIRRTAERDEEFSQRLKKAESDLEVYHLGLIRDAAKKYWRASAWVLERVAPERFGNRDPRTITAEQVGAALSCLVDILIEEVSFDEQQENVLRRVEALIAELEASGSSDGATRENSASESPAGDDENSDGPDSGDPDSGNGNNGP